MNLQVTVFDRDKSRSAQIARAVRAVMSDFSAEELDGKELPAFDVGLLDSQSELAFDLSDEVIDVLVMVLDKRSDEEDDLGVIERMVPVCGKVQVVYVDITGANATRVYETTHCYLLTWPFAEDDLASALIKALKLRAKWADQPLIIHTQQGDRKILPHQILYIESNRRVLNIHVGNDIVRMYGKLSDMARILPASFVQSHKSFLVNMEHIETIDRSLIYLTTGERVPVSQKRHRATLDAFTAYIGRKF